MSRSKQSIANEVYSNNKNGKRSDVLAAIIEATGASLAHANTMYYTAKKADTTSVEIFGSAPFVIYDTDSTLILKERKPNGCHTESYKTVSAAKAALTRLTKKGKTEKDVTYAISGANHFHENIEKMVERKNIMSGETFMEPINTPYYCSPSSETYWSM